MMIQAVISFSYCILGYKRFNGSFEKHVKISHSVEQRAKISTCGMISLFIYIIKLFKVDLLHYIRVIEVSFSVLFSSLVNCRVTDVSFFIRYHFSPSSWKILRFFIWEINQWLMVWYVHFICSRYSFASMLFEAFQSRIKCHTQLVGASYIEACLYDLGYQGHAPYPLSYAERGKITLML